MQLVLVMLAIFLEPSDRFLSEYPSEVEVLKREFANVRGTARLHAEVSGKIGAANLIRFATRVGCVKFEFEPKLTTATPKVMAQHFLYCREDTKCFQLLDKGEGQGYMITALGDDPLARGAFDATFGKYLNAPWAILNVDIKRWMAAETFRIVAANEIMETGRNLIEINFESGQRGQNPHKLRVAFDPTIHWAIVRAEVQRGVMPGRVAERSTVTYAPTSCGRTYINNARFARSDVTVHGVFPPHISDRLLMGR